MNAATKTETLTVEGMSCQHCVMRITEALKDLDAVQDVDVNLQAGKVKITGSGQLNKKKIKKTIEDAGYNVK